MYRYLFFQLYIWGRRRFGERDIPEYSASLFLALLAVMNVYNAVMLHDLILKSETRVDTVFGVALGAGAIAVHYVLLARQPRLEQICNEFRNQQPRTIVTALMWSYPILTVALFAFLAKLRLA